MKRLVRWVIFTYALAVLLANITCDEIDRRWS